MVAMVAIVVSKMDTKHCFLGAARWIKMSDRVAGAQTAFRFQSSRIMHASCCEITKSLYMDLVWLIYGNIARSERQNKTIFTFGSAW